jgi:putative ABC transport system ATP-binding protein
MAVIISAKNLTKVYKMGEVEVHALRGVDFEIYAGEFVVILGPSGSGKSTMLNIIGGIDSPTSGQVDYKNKSLTSAKEKDLTQYRRSSVGFVFQFYNLIPNLTAIENVELAAELSNSPIPARELLEQVGLLGHSNHFPSQMSGGEQQRIAIARALSKNPDILLCDEPTGALDISTGTHVLKVLKDFNTNYGKTVIIITHNSGIAAMGNRVFYLKDGLIDKIVVNENPVSASEVTW